MEGWKLMANNDEAIRKEYQDYQDYQKYQQYLASQKDPENGNEGMASLENFGNALTLGYLPQLQAAAAPAVYGLMNKITGGDVQPESYVKERDANIKRIEELSRNYPKSSMAGNIAGSVVGAVATPLPGFGLGKGLLESGAKGAIQGGILGGLSNPGDVEGEINPMQVKERLENTKSGSKFGAAAGFGAGALSKGFDFLRKSPDVAEKIANEQAIRASGGMLKDFRVLNAKDKVDDVGRFALDKGIVRAGDTFDDVAIKADEVRKKAGKSLEKIYDTAKNSVKESDFRGFNPSRDKDAILNSIDEALGNSAGKESAKKEIESYLNQLTKDHGDKLLDPKTANDIKSAIDREINYARNPLTKKPVSEKAYSALREYLSDRIDEHIKDVGKALKKPNLSKKLAEANKDYGFSKQLQNMAEDKVNRESSNRIFGLTDTIAGGAGAGAGALVGQGLGDGKTSEGALVGGLLGALANKTGRTYGPAILSRSADIASPILKHSAEPIGKLGGLISPDVLTRSAIQSKLNKKNK